MGDGGGRGEEEKEEILKRDLYSGSEFASALMIDTYKSKKKK